MRNSMPGGSVQGFRLNSSACAIEVWVEKVFGSNVLMRVAGIECNGNPFFKLNIFVTFYTVSLAT
jgi:hypothetical protein